MSIFGNVKIIDTNDFHHYNTGMKKIIPLSLSVVPIRTYCSLFIAHCLLLILASPCLAVDVAPRISDKEIVEKLSALDAKIDREIANVRGDIKEIQAEIKGLQQQI